MIDIKPPAVIAFVERSPVYSVFHGGAEYWVYQDHGVYKTCNGTVVPLTLQERKRQPHPERVPVTCDDNRLDAHALHPKKHPTPTHRPGR